MSLRRNDSRRTSLVLPMVSSSSLSEEESFLDETEAVSSADEMSSWADATRDRLLTLFLKERAPPALQALSLASAAAWSATLNPRISRQVVVTSVMWTSPVSTLRLVSAALRRSSRPARTASASRASNSNCGSSCTGGTSFSLLLGQQPMVFFTSRRSESRAPLRKRCAGARRWARALAAGVWLRLCCAGPTALSVGAPTPRDKSCRLLKA